MTRAEAAAIARAARAANVPPLADRFWSKVDVREVGCWLWKASVRRKNEGYGAFWLNGRHQPAHRVAWEIAHNQAVPRGMVVCHKCDNPRCCNPDHLFIGTPEENNNDKVAKQRQARGAKVNTAKLTEDAVRAIKLARPQGGRAPYGYRKAIADQHGVRPGTITDIWSRSWTHVR